MLFCERYNEEIGYREISANVEKFKLGKSLGIDEIMVENMKRGTWGVW